MSLRSQAPRLAARSASWRASQRRAFHPRSAWRRASKLDAHFSAIYGERWPELRAAMLGPSQHVALLNPLHASAARAVFTETTHEIDIAGVSLMTSPQTLPQPAPLDDGRPSHYNFDRASVLPALALAPQPGHRVLDACAAPGGKALALAAQILHVGGELICNDKSMKRRAGLERMLQNYLRGTDAAIRVTGADATRPDVAEWPSHFDRILVDAPCSSERHIMQAPRTPWTPSRLARDADVQLRLLRAAASRLAPGGLLVYATCSLAPTENDEVVDRLLAEKRPLVLHDAMEAGHLADAAAAPLRAGAERTRRGAIVLPDAADGAGPLYWAVLGVG